MLIENKFIYLSMPRTASTSFLFTCYKNKLDIKHYREDKDFKNFDLDFENQDFKFLDLFHVHESLDLLHEKFGNNFDVISVKRDPYESFLSQWKLNLKFLEEFSNKKEVADKLRNVDENTLLNFEPEIIFFNDKKKYDFIEDFLKQHDISLDKSDRLYKALSILLMPRSVIHRHDKNIIWFDFNKLNELENWVSDKLQMNFKMIKMNQSGNVECKLQNTPNFRKMYDNCFSLYDFRKDKKTLF